MTKKTFVLLLPVYNEENSLSLVINEWRETLTMEIGAGNFTLLAVNDGSTDGSQQELENLQSSYEELLVINKENTGHGPSCVEGYRYAVESGAEWIFQIDSDGQCDPKFFSEFWQQRSKALFHFGFRKKRADGIFRSLVTRLFSLYLFCVTGHWIRDANVPYRLMRANSLKSLLPFVPKDSPIANAHLALLIHRYFGIRWIDIHFRQRTAGRSTLKIFSFIGKSIQVAVKTRASLRKLPNDFL